MSREYTVSMSGVTADALRVLHAAAAADGRHAEFLAAVQTISARLRSDPLVFGEELFDLRAMRVNVRLALLLPVAVEFGVYPDRHLVFIRAFRYLPPPG